MIGPKAIAESAQRILENFSIPVRMTSYIEAPFWSLPLTLTRARPLPVNGGAWTDFFSVPVNNLFSRVVHSYVLTPRTEGQVEFRWIKGGSLLYPESFQLPVAVERHIDRLAVHPYPCHFRKTFVVAKHDEELRIQARNLSANLQLIFGAVVGWYYPALKSPNEITPDTGIDDATRSI